MEVTFGLIDYIVALHVEANIGRRMVDWLKQSEGFLIAGLMLVYIQCELNTLIIETGRRPETRKKEEKRKAKRRQKRRASLSGSNRHSSVGMSIFFWESLTP